MLDPDEELKLLEEEWRRSKANSESAAPAPDEKILQLSVRVAELNRGEFSRRADFRKNLERLAAPAKTARPRRGKSDFLQGIAAAKVLESSVSEMRSFFDESHSSKASVRIRKYLKLLENAESKEWLTLIASLVKKGEIRDAISLLDEYLKRFEAN